MKLTAHDARRRLAHEHDTRTDQLGTLEGGPEGTADEPAKQQAYAIRGVLAEIEEARRRLESGSYGVCVGCSLPIPVERLETLPYASRCVSCQRRLAM